jgi:hypothetical protein
LEVDKKWKNRGNKEQAWMQNFWTREGRKGGSLFHENFGVSDAEISSVEALLGAFGERIALSLGTKRKKQLHSTTQWRINRHGEMPPEAGSLSARGGAAVCCSSSQPT